MEFLRAIGPVFNFLLLAGALFFLTRKRIRKLFRDRKERIAEALGRAADAQDQARHTAEDIAEAQQAADAQAQCQLADAQRQAAANTAAADAETARQAEAVRRSAQQTEAQLRSKLEPEKALFIAESGKVIERALAAGMEPLSLLMEAKWLPAMQPIIDEISARWGDGVPVFVAPHDELTKLTGFELTRGALGAFRRPQLPSVADIVRGARRIAVLEDITNHTNVGAIFRSAAALGIDAVLVTPACYDPLYRRAVRVSMGTVFQVKRPARARRARAAGLPPACRCCMSWASRPRPSR